MHQMDTQTQYELAIEQISELFTYQDDELVEEIKRFLGPATPAAVHTTAAAVYYVDRLDTNDKPYIPVIPLPQPNDIDYNPFSDKKHRIRFNTPFHDSRFNIDFFNATSAEGEPLIGSARLPLRDLVLGDRAVKKKLVLMSPSGSPIGEVTVMVAVRRVENPLPPEKTVTVVYEELAFDENDLT